MSDLYEPIGDEIDENEIENMKPVNEENAAILLDWTTQCGHLKSMWNDCFVYIFSI